MAHAGAWWDGWAAAPRASATWRSRSTWRCRPSCSTSVSLKRADGFGRVRWVASESAPSKRSRLLPSNDGCPSNAPFGKAALTGSSSLSKQYAWRKRRNDAIGKPGSRPDNIARHQGAPVGDLERLDGPPELRAMVGSGAGQVQSRGNGSPPRWLV